MMGSESVNPWRGFTFSVSWRASKLSFRAFLSRRSNLTQAFVESCVHFPIYPYSWSRDCHTGDSYLNSPFIPPPSPLLPLLPLLLLLTPSPSSFPVSFPSYLSSLSSYSFTSMWLVSWVILTWVRLQRQVANEMRRMVKEFQQHAQLYNWRERLFNVPITQVRMGVVCVHVCVNKHFGCYTAALFSSTRTQQTNPIQYVRHGMKLVEIRQKGMLGKHTLSPHCHV